MKLTIKADRLDDEHKKKLFHELVAHIKYVEGDLYNQMESFELKALLAEYIHQLKKLRGTLRNDLEREVVEGISRRSKANLSEVLGK